MIKRFAVFGSPINHSLSPLIHYLLAKQTGIKLRYDKQLVEPQNFEREVRFFFENHGCGLNITSPLKELAYAISDIQTKGCKAAKSANTLWYEKGQIHADNTDGEGLLMDLKTHVSFTAKSVLIIGAGGAARGIIDVIQRENPYSISILNKSQKRLNILIEDFPFVINADFEKKYDIIINTTPSAAEILPDSVLKKAQFCYDLIYKYNDVTQFESRSLRLAVPAKNGLGMLINQASLSFARWHSISPNFLTCLNLIY